MNRADLIGHLGGDPETRSLNSGGSVVTFSIATTERWNDREGQRQERTEWHRVVIFNEGLGKIASRYLRKGSKAYVSGKIQTRQWEDNEGVKRYSTEIVLTNFDGKIELLDRAEGGGRDYSSHQDGNAKDRGSGGQGTQQTFSDDLDDDVPF